MSRACDRPARPISSSQANGRLYEYRYACVRHSSTNEALSRDCRRKDCLVYHSQGSHRVLSTQENNDTSSFTPVCGWSSG